MAMINGQCECGTPLPDAARFCSGCGEPVGIQPSNDQRYNEGGLNAGRDISAGRDLIFQSQQRDPFDRVEMPYGRTDAQQIMPPDLLSIISGVIGVGTFLFSVRLPSVLAIVGILVGGAGIMFSARLMRAGRSLRDEGFDVLPFGLGLFERDSRGRVWWTTPISACPLCPEGKDSAMSVHGTTDRPSWICSLSSKHGVKFDITHMPELESTP
ncbi:zinc ribbon domain-containing protein [Luteipulveratus mongoliensis]|uniref:Zinc-ribbon domain-containing protein n=1 Tax=Luteipulveratus mongoliensis TaxID=571913 RepID=A0A0K1JNE9_9MICO|nr:zinc ribbon domain-containing protein [Luteipulveratus mongoliensis]AKU18221.1 hypothetical protein VV02_24155 [Luteipulveratus mongoliensis]